MEEINEITIGTRLIINGFTCTVLWIGELEGVKGKRIGVEWDDENKGKHSGEYLGKQYFQPKRNGCASFLKFPTFPLSRNINIGTNLWEGIRKKYLDTSGVEDVSFTLEDRPNVKFETLGFKKVQEELSNSKNLKTISLTPEIISWIDFSLNYSTLLPSLEDLDLSKSLISSWEPIMTLALELNNLKRLSLNDMRFVSYSKLINGGLENIRVLSLNQTLISEHEIKIIEPYLINLEELQICSNSLKRIPIPSENKPWFLKLKVLNLETNLITGEEEEILESLKYYKSLEYLNIGFNPLNKLYLKKTEKVYSITLKRLNLNYTKISDLEQMIQIYKSFPNLEHLQTLGIMFTKENHLNYLTKDKNLVNNRTLLVSFVPSLQFLNITKITKQERIDSELFYINQICLPQYGSLNHNEFIKHHPQFDTLCKKYNIDLKNKKEDNLNNSNKLKQRLIELGITIQKNEPLSGVNNEAILSLDWEKKEFLNNVTIRILSMNIKKLFKLPINSTIKLYALIENKNCKNDYQIIELDNPVRQLVNFYGIKSGDYIWVYLG
ncbi:hypothetical protein K502DRAFT_308446 [Neoconidiobolus thromboides FSU 785]|nr:hypothetical protein K502DRAFT_308446 [Neoconidiobolus thromboides FSU 785]